MRQTNSSIQHAPLIVVATAALLAGGCLATRGYVESQVSESEVRTEERVEGLETQVEENQTQIAAQGEQIDDAVKRIDEMSDTAREALGRAIAAGKVAEGKLIYETVLTDEDVQFGVSKAALTDAAQARLAEIAAQLTEENTGVFLEIQGHTDSTGSEAYNLLLGERRAEAVRTYLSREHHLPLHRMSVISYGESRPIADNSTSAGRAQNRRVTIVVLK
jgi:peptidoglycan-associated lipoprotein